jgi:tRNA uridine 5-carboxymethylaminomethyl modification enzyme
MQADRMRTLGAFALANDLPYDDMRSMSMESRQKLSRIRPATLAQASRIPGVSPSDLQNLVIEVEKRRKGSATTRTAEQTAVLDGARAAQS